MIDVKVKDCLVKLSLLYKISLYVEIIKIE